MGLALGLGLGYVKEVGSTVITRTSYVAKGGRDKIFPQNKKRYPKLTWKKRFCTPQILYVHSANLKYCMYIL